MLLNLGPAYQRKQWKEHVGIFLSWAMREHAQAEVAELNGYATYLRQWRDDVSRLVGIELPIFLEGSKTKTPFNRFQAVEEVIASMQSGNAYRRWLTVTTRMLASGYFKQTNQKTDFTLPDVESSEAAFWLQVRSSIEDVFTPPKPSKRLKPEARVPRRPKR
jgi:hypothetical protein